MTIFLQPIKKMLWITRKRTGFLLSALSNFIHDKSNWKHNVNDLWFVCNGNLKKYARMEDAQLVLDCMEASMLTTGEFRTDFVFYGNGFLVKIVPMRDGGGGGQEFELVYTFPAPSRGKHHCPEICLEGYREVSTQQLVLDREDPDAYFRQPRCPVRLISLDNKGELILRLPKLLAHLRPGVRIDENVMRDMGKHVVQRVAPKGKTTIFGDFDDVISINKYVPDQYEALVEALSSFRTT